MNRTMTLEMDADDFRSIEEAIAKRMSWNMMPDSDSNTEGAVLGEICRGWMEMLSLNPKRPPS